MPLIKNSPNRWVWITVIVIVVLFLLSRLTGIPGDSRGMSLGPKVGIVEIEGVIYSSKTLIEKLEKLRKRDDISAIVVRIDSPGGSVAPTQEIYAKVSSVNDEKPVVISVGTAAASGGYYIAVGAQKILANPGSILGSIGVRFDFPVVVELMDKIGLKFETFKSGDLKDAGSPTREVTDKDREFFQSVVSNIREQFVDVVAEGRNMSLDMVNSLADGRIFTGEQALELGLVDSLGTLEDAILVAGELGGIDGKPKVFEFEKKRPTVIDALWGNLEEKIDTRIHSIGTPSYLWKWE